MDYWFSVLRKYFILYVAVTAPQPSSPEEQDAEKKPGIVINQRVSQLLCM